MLKLELSTRDVLIAAAAIGAIFLMMRLWPVLLLVVTALIFMTALLPYVEWLVARGLPRVWAVLLIFAAIIAIIAGLVTIVVPAMIEEFQDLKDDLPEDARQLEDLLANFGINVELEQRARDVDWGELVSGERAVDYGRRAFFAVASTITVLAITAYLLVDTPRLSAFLYQFVPPGREPDVDMLLKALGRVVGGYVRGQLITSVAIAVFTFIVLYALQVPNAVAFAVLAGFADIIPLVGAFIAVIPPVVATFDISPTKAVIVLVLLLLYQQFEDRFLTPRVYGQTLSLPPLIVLIAILAGGELLGIAGVLLALPAAAVARVALDYWLDKRSAGITPPGPPGDPLAPDVDAAPAPGPQPLPPPASMKEAAHG